MDENSRDIALEQRIDAYINGELSEEEAKELWVELLKQPENISRLQTEIDLARMYRQDKSLLNRYWKWFASAAAVILLIISINVLMSDHVNPIKTWTESSIDVVSNMASAEVTRSSETMLNPADSLLNAGFKAAVSGDLENAGQIFQRVADDFANTSAASKAHLNLGILQYNSGDYASSIESFNKAISQAQGDSLIMEQSYWYKSNALVNSDLFKEARDAVEKSYQYGRIYKNQSLKLLKRLDYELGNIDYDNFEKQMQESE